MGLKLVLTRVPPGDNWKYINKNGDIKTYASLTDALNAVFADTGVTDFYVEARKGIVSIQGDEDEVIVTKKKTYNIYGDET